MSQHLQDKVVVITGAGGGFGKLIAEKCAAAGARVVGVDIGAENLAAVFDGIREAGLSGTSHVADVTDIEQMKAAVQHAVQTFGAVDVIVNNAGVMPLAYFADHDKAWQHWHRAIDINIKGVVNGISAVYDQMIEQGRGHVVNISSIYGIVGGADIPAYHASKGAVRTMSKNDALTFAPDKIRVNSVHPGFIFTALVDRYVKQAGWQHDQAKTALDALHPLGGTGHPDDIAWGVVYLASDEARWVTGSELVIDGGYLAR